MIPRAARSTLRQSPDSIVDYLAAAPGCYSFGAGRKRPVRPVKAP